MVANMTDLMTIVSNYWKQFRNSNINHTLINIEHIESSMYELTDDEEVKVIELLDYIAVNKINNNCVDSFVQFMVSIPSPYMYFILHKLSESNSEFSNHLIDTTNDKKDKDDNYKNFHQKNVLFETMQIISRVFSSDRVNKFTLMLSN